MSHTLGLGSRRGEGKSKIYPGRVGRAGRGEKIAGKDGGDSTASPGRPGREDVAMSSGNVAEAGLRAALCVKSGFNVNILVLTRLAMTAMTWGSAHVGDKRRISCKFEFLSY